MRMTITDNRELVREIEKVLTRKMPVRLGVNKKNELVRLFYEICRANDDAPSDVMEQAGVERLAEDGKGELFHRVKSSLLALRYPTMGPHDDPHIMPVAIDTAFEECPVWDFELSSRRIFIEKSISGDKWTKNFLRNFPEAEIREINDLKDGLRDLPAKDPVLKYNTRRENIFLVRNKSSFIKICPCTKGYKRCGYWILNLGFGCPIDCSYCYLQIYSNTPGIVLPANIEEYYTHILEFDAGLSSRTRIGTGEFTDSLALDSYTGYSSCLIPFFGRAKNLVLELKTKIGDLDNVLKEEPNDNVVISWSVNTPKIAGEYEKGGAAMPERLKAAEEAARRGYKVGFHFDPVVSYPGWEADYKETVDDMFSREILKKNTAWVSIGTLRFVPAFKQVVERRFGGNLMFYQAEFFMDTDGKLRYPRRFRIDMYNKMVKWINAHDISGWIYLCMEPEEVWKETPLKQWEYAGR